MSKRDWYMSIWYDLVFHAPAKEGYSSSMASTKEQDVLYMLDMITKNPVYRIKIEDDSSVQTDCYDMLDDFAPELKKFYLSLDELPKWVQDKLAVLMLFDPDKRNEELENIGRRINKNIFWVYKRDNDGGYPREES
jgi:hypothetical protein